MPVSLTLSVPDAIAARVVDAVCARHGYDPAGGLTKAQFVREWMKRLLVREAREYEENVAGDTARQAAAQKASSEIVW